MNCYVRLTSSMWARLIPRTREGDWDYKGAHGDPHVPFLFIVRCLSPTMLREGLDNSGLLSLSYSNQTQYN